MIICNIFFDTFVLLDFVWRVRYLHIVFHASSNSQCVWLWLKICLTFSSGNWANNIMKKGGFIFKLLKNVAVLVHQFEYLFITEHKFFEDLWVYTIFQKVEEISITYHVQVHVYHFDFNQNRISISVKKS